MGWSGSSRRATGRRRSRARVRPCARSGEVEVGDEQVDLAGACDERCRFVGPDQFARVGQHLGTFMAEQVGRRRPHGRATAGDDHPLALQPICPPADRRCGPQAVSSVGGQARLRRREVMRADAVQGGICRPPADRTSTRCVAGRASALPGLGRPPERRRCRSDRLALGHFGKEIATRLRAIAHPILATSRMVNLPLGGRCRSAAHMSPWRAGSEAVEWCGRCWVRSGSR